MEVPRRRLRAGDLLAGEDHDFVVNLYLAVLRRWPDAAGYRHFLAKVVNRPEGRLEALREMTGSEEAARLGGLVEMAEPLAPSSAEAARDAMLAVRTEVLHDELMRLREALTLLSGLGGGELATLQQDLAAAQEAELRAELNALRREIRGVAPPAPSGTAQGLAVALEQAMGGGVQRLEARLAALEARLPPDSGR